MRHHRARESLDRHATYIGSPTWQGDRIGHEHRGLAASPWHPRRGCRLVLPAVGHLIADAGRLGQP